ncbi:hypothetical protein STEG23_012260, partial [Scotinomys teguina]
DVAIDLIQEELGCIDSAERPFPGNEKLKNYTNLDDTGQSVSKKKKRYSSTLTKEKIPGMWTWSGKNSKNL